MTSIPFRRPSLLPGIAVSLLLHAGLLAFLLGTRHAPPPPAGKAVPWLTVSLLPAAPPARPKPEPAPEPPPAPGKPSAKSLASATRPRVVPPIKAAAMAAATAATVTAPREPQAITLPPANAANTIDPADPFAVPPSKAPGKFDQQAALQSARKLAVAKAGKDDPAVAQLRDKPVNGLDSESGLGKDIKKGARPDCLMSGAGAGLLAPLVIAAQVLTDKKDHGCKW